MKLYNTMSGKEEDIAPAKRQVKMPVNMYVCGVTPYAPCHIGHAMSYVIFDTLRRHLEFRGFQVRHIQNFTDIDDKIINRANQEGVSYRVLADRYIDEYKVQMERLNVRPPTVYALATDAMPKIIDVISGLIDKGYAYSSNGDVYFRVTKDDDYGKLSHRSLDSMIAGARIDVAEAKEHPMDFALWKAAKPGEPSWDSPWGQGRPGWHIECTSICLEQLGDTLDIHGGGLDLVFPHHENEIAQSESFTGKVPFSRVWVHNGLLQMGAEKMSKSLGNLVTVSEALERYSVDALRLFFLSSHYRSPLSYSPEGVASQERAAERLRHALSHDSPSSATELDPSPFEKSFIDAMDSDLNTPQALAALFDLSREINRAKDQGQSIKKAQGILRKLGGILGLTFQAKTLAENNQFLAPVSSVFNEMGGLLDASGHHKLAGWVKTHKDSPDLATLVETLLAIRRELRQAKDYKLADAIRHKLTDAGIAVEDTRDGAIWKPRL
ncbi:MAG: cysteine--tRNA ligase [SAR202 cluster bacterium]|nr:cysteine--tRNA ligase [SAR202 cluster bacterium]